MEDDIQNYLPTVMFSWDTPCITFGKMPLFVKNGNAHKYYFHAAFLIV